MMLGSGDAGRWSARGWRRGAPGEGGWWLWRGCMRDPGESSVRSVEKLKLGIAGKRRRFECSWGFS